jgi:hypothetical protein
MTIPKEQKGDHMKYSRKQLDRLVADLKRQHDQLKVKLRLAKADARGEWAKLEKKYKTVRKKMPLVKKEVEKTAGSTGAALGQAAKEIKRGFARLKKMM